MSEGSKKMNPIVWLSWLASHPWVFPSMMIALSVASSAAYFWSGDVRRGIYWAAASVLTSSMTF